MPGGGGGVASRGVPLSRSISDHVRPEHAVVSKASMSPRYCRASRRRSCCSAATTALDRLGTTEGACRDPAERPGRAVCRLRPRRQFVATEALAETGLHHIQAASFVSPKIVPGWADAEDVVAGFTPKEGVTYTGLWFNAAGLNRALVFRNKLDDPR